MSIKELFADRHDRRALVAACLAFLALGASQSMYGPFYPYFRSLFGLSGAQVGLMATFHFTGATAAVFAGGFLVRRFGYRRILLGGSVILAVGYAGIAQSPSWPLVLSSVLLLGVGFGALVTFNFLIDELFGRMGPAALNLANSAFGFGAILGPLLAGLSLSLDGHHLSFAIGAALSVTVVVLVAGISERVPARETETTGRRAAIAGTVAFVGYFLLYVGAESSSSGWIPTNLAPSYGVATAATLTALFWAALTAGRLAAVPLSMRIGPRTLATGGMLLALTSTAAAAIPAIAPAAFMFTGFFLGPVFPAGLSWIRRTFPGRAARISSVAISGGGLGGVFFPPLVGAAVDRWGSQAVPPALAAILAAALAAAFGISRLFPGAKTSSPGSNQASQQ